MKKDSRPAMKIAFVGAGFVADYYMTTLANYPDLELAGVWDRDTERLRAFCDFHDVRAYDGLDAVLDDEDVEIVVDLTTPESHFAINQAALSAGKHVYCEKPLAMTVAEAEALVSLAEEKGLALCVAPANALSEAFEFCRSLLAQGRIGRPRLVYAEMEDGPVFRANWQEWRSRSGAPWPGAHEFEIGCTLEHSGYGLSWLVGLFGPVAHVAAFSALAFPDKGPGTRHLTMAPDFSVGCLTFRSGVVARLTCGFAAPRNRALTVMGERGTMTVRDLWDDRSPIDMAADDERSILQRVANLAEHRLGRTLPFRVTTGRRMAYPGSRRRVRLPAYPSQIDFARGIQRQAEAVRAGRAPFFSGRVALHLTELTLALNAGLSDYRPRTGFDEPAFPAWQPQQARRP